MKYRDIQPLRAHYVESIDTTTIKFKAIQGLKPVEAVVTIKGRIFSDGHRPTEYNALKAIEKKLREDEGI